MMKYSGILGKPIVRQGSKGLSAYAILVENVTNDDNNYEYNQQLNKLPALFLAHSVPIGDWQGLAFSLAKAHVTGFKVVGQAGRKTRWEIYDKTLLKMTIDDEIKANPKLTVASAITRVMKMEMWKDKTRDMKVSALSKHYYAADDRWVAVMRMAIAYDLIIKKD